MGLKQGTVIKAAFDIYTVGGQIGAGGSGEVYEVADAAGKPFALKVLSPERANRDRLQRFKNEIAFSIKHGGRSIVPVLEYGATESGATFYVMPLYHCTLGDLIAEGIKRENVLPYFSQLLDGVEEAHLRKVWHRDIKPANILYSQGEDRLVVADFGIAHFEEEELLTAVETKSQERLANFQYAAPEQKRRGSNVDAKADVYAVGLILNEMFTGEIPQGTGFRKIADVAQGFAYLDGIVELMIRQDPAARPTIEEIKRELIARGNEFVAVQRLNSMKSEIIPETELDDAVVRNPIRITRIDYHQPYLIYELSATPPPDWMMAFRDPRAHYSSYMGKGPETFNFQKNQINVQLSGSESPEQMTLYAKQFVELANQRYREIVTKRHADTLREQQEVKQRKIRDAEERRKMLERISGIKL